MFSEYHPSALNVHADWESLNAKNNLDWKLHVSVFQKIVTHTGQPTLDLFASRFCHQLPHYIAWKPDPDSIATDAFLHPWDREYRFAFLPFRLISRVLRKILQEKLDYLIIVTPTWKTQPWYAQLSKWKKFQAILSNVSHIQGEKAQQLITNWPGVSGLAGVMKDKLILFKYL